MQSFHNKEVFGLNPLACRGPVYLHGDSDFPPPTVMHVGVSKLSIGVNEIGLQVEENGWTNKSEGLFVQRI